jgi:hypothetical protein
MGEILNKLMWNIIGLALFDNYLVENRIIIENIAQKSNYYLDFVFLKLIQNSGSTDYNPVEQLFQEALALVDKNYGGGGRRGGPTLDLRKNYAFYLYAKTKNIAKVFNFSRLFYLK